MNPNTLAQIVYRPDIKPLSGAFVFSVNQWHEEVVEIWKIVQASASLQCAFDMHNPETLRFIARAVNGNLFDLNNQPLELSK
jgi:hypothetical protein